ncbi:MAG: inositol-3-phosphate synthase [Candidatus Bathyarchaeota archaeon]|nr:inositol-3-phosphate synthase [Candidatus Bathyarchaeota archaeon]
MGIRVAIAGVGNCASALIQGVEYYKDAKRDEMIPGVMHVYFGDYHINEIEFVAAFEVNKHKIGKDLSEAIWAEPNNCAKFAEVPETDVIVQPAPIMDGVAPHMYESFHADKSIEPVDVAQVLRDTKADMLINYLPVGSAEATQMYAQACLDAGCAFINCIPEFIASRPEWAQKFVDAGLPVAGDDIKSQVGATILHRVVAKLFYDRGVVLDSTYQLNIGGNTDFENMTVENRLQTKRVSKTQAVQSLIPYDVPTRIGPSDYVPFLEDQKICYIRVNSHSFGNLPITFDAKLVVNDSPNSAGVVIDAIRATKIALDRKISGPLLGISSYSFKHPPQQVSDDKAHQWVEDFIQGKVER